MIKGPWIKRLIAVLVLTALALLGASLLVDQHPGWNAPISSAKRYSRGSFDRWLAEEPGRSAAFTAFASYLAAQGVSGVVPDWQLLRTDMNDRIGCPRPAFLMPPRREWPHIVPALRLLKDHVVPAVGQVEVVSSYRTEGFNACVNGAAQSRHLGFAAVDLVTTTPMDNRTLFSRLCALHQRLGPNSRFGLGAYFDPESDARNRNGRFHVDAAGFRSWGFSKKSASSGCRLLSGG
ncbi:MAG: D-Ala-D-Ala carboxypeptidase family metallohydrolase [Novosphingobium sp.]